MPSRKKSKESRGRKKSKESRSRSRKAKKASRTRKPSPFALYVKKHFHDYYHPGSDRKKAFSSAIKKVAAAYNKSR